jgi:tetratricopeptide (TPR) repeat protein
MARVLRTTGDPDGAIAAGRQALDLAAELGESALQMQASLRLGQVYWALGDFGRAAELLRWNVEAADQASGAPSIDAWSQAQAHLAWTLSDLGAFAEGRRHWEEALRLATLAGRGDIPITVHNRTLPHHGNALLAASS